MHHNLINSKETYSKAGLLVAICMIGGNPPEEALQWTILVKPVGKLVRVKFSQISLS